MAGTGKAADFEAVFGRLRSMLAAHAGTLAAKEAVYK
jgi:hypothetical protein